MCFWMSDWQREQRGTELSVILTQPGIWSLLKICSRLCSVCIVVLFCIIYTEMSLYDMQICMKVVELHLMYILMKGEHSDSYFSQSP